MKYKTVVRYKYKKGVLVATSLILLAVAGGIGYWLWKRNKDTSSDSTTPETSPETNIVASNEPISVTEDKPSDVLSFQQYANSRGWSPKLVEDGLWGSKSKLAWAKFGADFKKSKGIISTGFQEGDKIFVRIPLLNAIAYSRKTGKAVGRIKTATFVKDSTTKGWFFAKAYIPVGPYQTPTLTDVQLQTKDWYK